MVKSDLNPKWSCATLNLEALCNGDMSRAMKVIIMDHKRSGRHTLIGEFETTLQRFIDAKNEGGDIDEDFAFTLRKNDKKTGNVLILQASVDNNGMGSRITPSVSTSSKYRQESVKARPEFIDYLTGGCQISLAVAIDFTASNGTFSRTFENG